MKLLNQKSKSFLVRIFISFLTIIMLLSVFNFVLFSFFSTEYQAGDHSFQ